jgi:hypothetical protein
MKLTSAHLVVSSFAALAGVALAAYQAFAPSASTQPQIVVAVPAAAPAAAEKADATTATEVAKTDIAAVEPAVLDPEQGIAFAAALKDDSEQRYSFADLFDGRTETVLTIAAPDRELNILVDFSRLGPQTVTGLVYEPPQGASDPLATTLDVMVLPDGRLEPSGRPVMSFALQTAPGKQTFTLPSKELGTGLWLRLAGPEGAARVSVGDFRILRAN